MALELLNFESFNSPDSSDIFSHLAGVLVCVEFAGTLARQMADILGAEILLKVRIDRREIFQNYRGAGVAERTQFATHIQHRIENLIPRGSIQFCFHMRSDRETFRTLIGLELVSTQR